MIYIHDFDLSQYIIQILVWHGLRIRRPQSHKIAFIAYLKIKYHINPQLLLWKKNVSELPVLEESIKPKMAKTIILSCQFS